MGLREYVNDMWNVVDFVTNALYVATVALRLVAYYRVSKCALLNISCHDALCNYVLRPFND